MIRGVRLRLSLVVVVLALGLGASPAWAQQQPAGEPAGGAVPKPHLWWNNPQLVAKLSLTAEQRAQMDRLFETYQRESGRGRGAKARVVFYEALAQGDAEGARRELGKWANAERGQIQALGDLKLAVLALLNTEQRKALASVRRDLIRMDWTPRPFWEMVTRRPPGDATEAGAPARR